MKKLFALCLSLLLLLCFPVGVSAEQAEVPGYLIDENKTGSLTIYKYDLTNSEKDNVWDSSYVSTGVYDQNVNNTLGGSSASSLGNGNSAYGYAIPGVEFTCLKVADIVQFSQGESNLHSDSHVEVLYGFDKALAADFLNAIGLGGGAQRYENADYLDGAKYFYQSDVLIDALEAALTANATTVKNALESYVVSKGGTAMPLTDSYGKTSASNLPLGLYLMVETKVPEMVTSTVNPFLVSVPMTAVDGTNATDGSTRWIYDITLYPKNLTGIPTLEKTLRETVADTGKNNGSADIADGYAHTGTASDGDVIDYQIISTLPSITSRSTYLSAYTFIDTLSKGISYNRGDVVLTFYKDSGCKEKIATWTEADGKFRVSYTTTEKNESVMTIEMTEAGLNEINTSRTVYTSSSMVNSGYSDCTLRITYKATMGSNASVVYGDVGNPNDVVLLWQRSSNGYYDTLVDDAHVYTYAIDLTKLFSDGNGDFTKVEFLLHNDTDNYYIQAKLNETEGIYYVTGHTESKDEATHLIPIKVGDNNGKVIVKGLENDTYTISEVRTASGYTLLKTGIQVAISNKETSELCEIYASDVLGLIQNDPQYVSVSNGSVSLNNIPQAHLEHYLLTASATVDKNAVNMKSDNGSKNAAAPLTIINTRGFNLPQTGDTGTLMFSVVGILLMSGAAAVIVLALRKKKAA